jgi:hypothetical protein
MISRNRLAVVAAFVTVLSTASLAHAQAARTWVSGVGDDANPCSRTAPCKTFAGAISKTATGGEINTLDPGGFGAVTITKSITIDGTAGLGSILAAGTNGIIVNATGANDVVILRSLDLNGNGTGLSGVRVLAARDVYVENCKISGFSSRGISDERFSGRLFVSDTVLSNNASTGIAALAASPSALVFSGDRVRLLRNGNAGLMVGDGVKVTLSNSVVSGNINYGVYAIGGQVNLDGNVISSNGVGVQTGAGVVRLSNSAVTGNSVGLAGNVYSYGTNRLEGNVANGTPTGSLPLQ